MADRPVIAVTGPDSILSFGWWAARLSLTLAGGKPVRLTPSTYHKHQKESFKGIVIGGGSDINPELYEGENSGLSKLDPERDAFEIEMIEHALSTSLPILGICRGAQLINVVLGGSLYSDIRVLRERTSNWRTPLPRKTALLEADGRLKTIMKTSRVAINSLHSQAIDRVGNGLKVVARDLDDFVQAIESTTDHFIIGTQWHPEYLFYIGKQLDLFRCLVSEASASTPEVLYD
jgi:putative glutamine amidotransferase